MSAGAGTAPPTDRSDRQVLFATAAVNALVPLNSTMIAVALPDIVADLGAGVSGAGWLVTSYLAAMALLQPVGGRLGDRVGRHRLTAIGLAGFAVASLGASLSPGLAALLAFRISQAVMGAFMVPNATAMLRDVVPADRRGRRFGVLGSVMGLSAAVGPLVGGVLVATAGWRSVFAVNVPAVVLAAVALARSPHGRHRPSAVTGARPALLRNRPFAAAAAANALGNLSMYTTLVVVPLALAHRDWGAGATGVALGALTLSMTVFAAIGGRLADRTGRRRPAVAGAALLAVAMVPLATTDGGLATAPLVAALILSGAGIGMATPALQTASLEAVPATHAGAAAGLYSTMRYAGSVTGTAAGTFIVDDRSGFGVAFAMAGVAAVLASVVALGVRQRGIDA